MRILILCTGNSCRSQMAHGFLQSFDPDITVCSAGTEASGKLNQKAVAVMKEIGIDISHHTSDSVDLYLGQFAAEPTKTARHSWAKSNIVCIWASMIHRMLLVPTNLFGANLYVSETK
jgi:hypothetical protein